MTPGKVKWTVELDRPYVKVYHSRLGLICAGTILPATGRITDIAFLEDRYRRSNMIRIPAMVALERWQKDQQAFFSGKVAQ